MSPLLKKGFDSSKCLNLLEVTLKRIKLLRNKRSVIVKQSKDDVAKLLQMGQDVNAAARVEYVIREANILAAYDLLEQYCQMITKGIKNIKSQKECPPDLKEAITGLIYAAPRCGDLLELQRLRDLFTANFGSEFIASVLEARPGCGVSNEITQYLSTRPPNTEVRLTILKNLAAEYKINWNYQKAAAALNKAKETSVISPSGSQALDSSTSTRVDKKPAEAVSTQGDPPKDETIQSKQDAIPSRVHQGPKELPGASPAPVVGRASRVDTNILLDFDKHHRQESLASQNKTPSKVRDTSHRRNESEQKVLNIGVVDKQKPPHAHEDKGNANKDSNAGVVDTYKPYHVHEDRGKVRESHLAGEPDFPIVNRAVPKKDGFLASHQPDGWHPMVADKERQEGPSPTFMHQGGPKRQADSPGIPLTPQAMNKQKVLTETSGTCMLTNPSPKGVIKEKTSSSAASDVGQPSPRPAFYQGRMFSPKPVVDPDVNLGKKSTTSPLTAGHELRSQKEPSVLDKSRRGDHDRSLGIPEGNVRLTVKATWGPSSDTSALSKQEEQIGKRNVEGGKDVYHEEEDSTVYEYYAREQMVGTLLRTPSGGRRHDGGKGKEGQKTAFGSQLSYQQKKQASNYGKYESNVSERPKLCSMGAMDPLVQHEFIPTRKIKAESEFSDLKTATEAKAAMDVVCQTSKMVGVLDDSASERRQASHRPFTAIKYETSIANKKGKGFDSTQHYQEEPVLSDAETPHFDDYSSDGSTTKEPTFHSKSKAAVTSQDDGNIKKRGTANSTNQQSESSLYVSRGYDGINPETWNSTVKKSWQQGINEEDDAESVEISIPKSSTSSYHQSHSEAFGFQRDKKPQYDENQEVMDVCESRAGNKVFGVRSRHGYGGFYHPEQQKQKSAVVELDDYIGKPSPWHIRAAGESDDHDKVRWSILGIREKAIGGSTPSQETRGADGAGKYIPLSRRSLRSEARQT